MIVSECCNAELSATYCYECDGSGRYDMTEVFCIPCCGSGTHYRCSVCDETADGILVEAMCQ